MESKKAPPIKSIPWGGFEFSEWDGSYEYEGRTVFSRKYSLSYSFFNKDRKKTETQSSISIDKVNHLSLIIRLIERASLGKAKTELIKIDNYSIKKNDERNCYELTKEYKDKNGNLGYSTLDIGLERHFYELLDLLNRCLALLIIPKKRKKQENSAVNIGSSSNQTNNFVSTEIDDDIPF